MVFWLFGYLFIYFVFIFWMKENQHVFIVHTTQCVLCV